MCRRSSAVERFFLAIFASRHKKVCHKSACNCLLFARLLLWQRNDDCLLLFVIDAGVLSVAAATAVASEAVVLSKTTCEGYCFCVLSYLFTSRTFLLFFWLPRRTLFTAALIVIAITSTATSTNKRTFKTTVLNVRLYRLSVYLSIYVSCSCSCFCSCSSSSCSSYSCCFRSGCCCRSRRRSRCCCCCCCYTCSCCSCYCCCCCVFELTARGRKPALCFCVDYHTFIALPLVPLLQ